MKISCLIIDDEPIARKGLKEYIADAGFLQLTGEYDSPLHATGIISSGAVQLLFLDIQMPRITGLDFFKTLGGSAALGMSPSRRMRWITW